MFMMLKTVLDTIGANQDPAIAEQKTTLPPEKLFLRSLRAILKHDALEEKHIVKLLAAARMALDALPLATVEHSQAAAALENAHSYFHSGVDGAARYELLALHRKMQGLLDVD